MPYETKSEWVNPKLFLRWKGLKIYRTYRDDVTEQGENRHDFTLNPECGSGGCMEHRPHCPNVFAVRNLPNWKESEEPKASNDWLKQEEAYIKKIIRDAIDKEYIGADGVRVRPFVVTIRLRIFTRLKEKELTRKVKAYLDHGTLRDGLGDALGPESEIGKVIV